MRRGSCATRLALPLIILLSGTAFRSRGHFTILAASRAVPGLPTSRIATTATAAWRQASSGYIPRLPPGGPDRWSAALDTEVRQIAFAGMLCQNAFCTVSQDLRGEAS